MKIMSLSKYLPQNPVEDIIFGLVSTTSLSGIWVMKELTTNILFDIFYIVFGMWLAICVVLFIYHMSVWWKETKEYYNQKV